MNVVVVSPDPLLRLDTATAHSPVVLVAMGLGALTSLAIPPPNSPWSSPFDFSPPPNPPWSHYHILKLLHHRSAAPSVGSSRPSFSNASPTPPQSLSAIRPPSYKTKAPASSPAGPPNHSSTTMTAPTGPSPSHQNSAITLTPMGRRFTGRIRCRR